MLKEGNSFSKIVVCGGKTDLRKGIDGLAAFVRLHFNLNPFEKGATSTLLKKGRSTCFGAAEVIGLRGSALKESA